jgi:hypothetical protein
VEFSTFRLLMFLKVFVLLPWVFHVGRVLFEQIESRLLVGKINYLNGRLRGGFFGGVSRGDWTIEGKLYCRLVLIRSFYGFSSYSKNKTF